MRLDEFLREKIQEYKRAHPRYSSAQIAKLWGLSTSSFNRLENLETKKPSVEQVIRILKGVGLKDDLYNILGEFYPELKTFFFDLSQHAKNLSITHTDLQTQGYFEKRDTYLIMAKGASRIGIPREEIKAPELIEKNILIKRENGKYGLPDISVALNPSSTQKLLSMAIDDCYKSENYLKSANWLSFLSESVDKNKVMPELVTILKETHAKIEKLFNDPNYLGEDTLFAGLVCDTLKKSEAL